MDAWMARMTVTMRLVLASHCCAASAIKSRVSTWADALVVRLICCDSRNVRVNEEEEKEEDEEAREEQGVIEEKTEQHGSVISGHPHESVTEPAVHGAGVDPEDASATSDPEGEMHADVVDSGESGSHFATTIFNGCLVTDRAACVLQRFLKNCVSTSHQRLPAARHTLTSPQVSTSPTNRSDEEHADKPRTQRSRRRRAPRVQPRRRSLSSPPNSYTRSQQPTFCSLQANVDIIYSSCSPSSSFSSVDSRSSPSWRDPPMQLAEENVVERRRLETTPPPRVYDFEMDPRFMSEQQLRRLAILRHRDAMRAKLIEKQQQQQED